MVSAYSSSQCPFKVGVNAPFASLCRRTITPQGSRSRHITKVHGTGTDIARQINGCTPEQITFSAHLFQSQLTHLSLHRGSQLYGDDINRPQRSSSRGFPPPSLSLVPSRRPFQLVASTASTPDTGKGSTMSSSTKAWPYSSDRAVHSCGHHRDAG